MIENANVSIKCISSSFRVCWTICLSGIRITKMDVRAGIQWAMERGKKKEGRWRSKTWNSKEMIPRKVSEEERDGERKVMQRLLFSDLLNQNIFFSLPPKLEFSPLSMIGMRIDLMEGFLFPVCFSPNWDQDNKNWSCVFFSCLFSLPLIFFPFSRWSSSSDSGIGSIRETCEGFLSWKTGRKTRISIFYPKENNTGKFYVGIDDSSGGKVEEVYAFIFVRSLYCLRSKSGYRAKKNFARTFRTGSMLLRKIDSHVLKLNWENLYSTEGEKEEGGKGPENENEVEKREMMMAKIGYLRTSNFGGERAREEAILILDDHGSSERFCRPFCNSTKYIWTESIWFLRKMTSKWWFRREHFTPDLIHSPLNEGKKFFR